MIAISSPLGLPALLLKRSMAFQNCFLKCATRSSLIYKLLATLIKCIKNLSMDCYGSNPQRTSLPALDGDCLGTKEVASSFLIRNASSLKEICGFPKLFSKMPYQVLPDLYAFQQLKSNPVRAYLWIFQLLWLESLRTSLSTVNGD